MIYCTGDTHGNWQMRLNETSFPEQKEMNKSDYVIICGDFGFWHDTDDEREALDWIDACPFTTLFVDGNHENFDRLMALPVSEWNGGKVHRIRPSVIHLMRGQVFDIDGYTVFAFGGAASHDIRDGILDPAAFADEAAFFKEYRKWQMLNRQFRIKNYSWWERELPNEREMEEGIINLKKSGNTVDFIITHSPDDAALQELCRTEIFNNKPDRLTAYLSKIKNTTDYRMHLFGHMHINKQLSGNTACLYEQIVRIA